MVFGAACVIIDWTRHPLSNDLEFRSPVLRLIWFGAVSVTVDLPALRSVLFALRLTRRGAHCVTIHSSDGTVSLTNVSSFLFLELSLCTGELAVRVAVR